MAIFAVQLRFTNNDRRMEVRPAHRDYLASLHAAGTLVTAGPWADDTGALLVYDVADEAALRDVIAADPYTPANVCEVTVCQEWTPLFAWGPSEG